MNPPGEHPEDTFTHRYVPALGKRIHRLGLAGDRGLTSDEFRRALEMGPQYVFWTPTMKKITPGLREALAADRERHIIATGPTLGFTARSLEKIVDKALKTLNTDYIDILQIFWLGRTSSWTSNVVDALVRLRETDKVRAIGTSIHDRPRAGRLAVDSPLDMLMIRYNAAHPGAEQDIFPHLHHRHPMVVGYTATAWGKLLSSPPGWDGPVATPGDCYRFTLSNPHVDVALTAPETFAQFEHNLAALASGPMEGEELEAMRAFGKAARSSGGRMRFFDF